MLIRLLELFSGIWVFPFVFEYQNVCIHAPMVDIELGAIENIVVTAILDAFRYIIFDNFQTDLFWLLDSTYYEDEFSVMCVCMCEFVHVNL